MILLLLAAACTDGGQAEPGLVPCAVDHHVEAGRCQPCPPGMGNEAGDNPYGGDSFCESILCDEDHHVVSNSCQPCAPGSTRPAGDNASLVYTACEPTLCGNNERVLGHACEPCRAGFLNEAGDDASGRNTDCDACPPGTFDMDRQRCEPCAPGSISEAAQTECEPCPAGTYAADNQCVSCPSDLESGVGAAQCHVPAAESTVGAGDYGYLFWPGNHWTWNRGRQYRNLQHVQTGYYGLIFDVGSAEITTMGPIAESVSARDAADQPNRLIEAMPGASVRYAVHDGGQRHGATGFFGRDRATTNPSELIDMGRYMQRIELPEVTYADADLEGSVQLAASPRHWVLSQRVTTARGRRPLTVSIELSGAFTAAYPQRQWLEEGRMLSLRNEAGAGWVFLVQREQGDVQLRQLEDGGIVFENRYAHTRPGQTMFLSAVGIPATAASPAQLALWRDREAVVGVEFAQARLDGSLNEAIGAAEWDPERGAFRIPLRTLRQAGAPGGRNYDASPELHNWYNRHLVAITNRGTAPISVPIAFDGGGGATTYIVAGSPLFRDRQGEPTGTPIQISKNWHDPPAWYHLYTVPTVKPGAHEMELTFAHSKWGEAYAVAHAQLSLIGWGQNQQWDQSSIGANGEAITYDPDLTLGRAMMDDVRPFLVDAGRRWNWTGNVGGADFLRYVDDAGVHQRLGRMRTHYELTGPNLTRVIYSGLSADGAVQARITTQLGRTDDMVRAIIHMDYELLDRVDYRRFALFQMAADRYADNGFAAYAYGHDEEVLRVGEITDHRSTGYAEASHRGIPLGENSGWTMLFANQRSDGNWPENLANIGFIVREFRAEIGEEVITQPHINLHRTFNDGYSQIGFELGLPFDEANRSLPVGSRLRATIEYVVPPAVKAAYYGDSPYLLAMPADQFHSPAMMGHLASKGRLTVNATVGTPLSTYPVVLAADSGATAAEFTMTGGLGYTPLVIDGLARPDGWRLERQGDDGWQRIDQSVHGNDYWQAYDNADGFSLIFNVRGGGRYRLVR